MMAGNLSGKMEELFNKQVPVSMKKGEREESQASIGISIFLNNITTPVHKKELMVRLTDESDPFFLFTLTINEDDFQQLKLQQGLLVDFVTFPQKFIDLLEQCLAEMGQDSPRFLLQLVKGCMVSDKGLATLSVVETNAFRYLTHLALQFVPASDIYLKKYLAECMLSLKEEITNLSKTLKVTKTDLTAQLAQSEEALSHRTRELDKLKSDWSARMTSLNNEHTAELTASKEKSVKVQIDMQDKFEREKKELESSYIIKIESLERKIKDLDTANKELTDRKYRSEAAIRELKAKLKGSEEELVSVRQELQQIRKENNGLDSGYHELDKTVNQLRTKIAVLEQELKDKEQVVLKTNELLEAATEQKHSLEVQLEQQQRQLMKLDNTYKQTSQEIIKGNEIIHKLQSELKGLKSKIKLRNMVTTQQEKLLKDKETEMEKYRNECQSLKDSLRAREDELTRVKNEISQLQQQIEEQKETLKNNENVITWLNKQINDQAITKGGGAVSHPHEVLSAIRPSQSASSALYQPRFSSTPSSVMGGVADGRQVLGTLQNHPQKVLFKAPPPLKQRSTLSVPSPLSAHSLSASPSVTTPTNIDQKRSPQNEQQLHRYLPPLTMSGPTTLIPQQGDVSTLTTPPHPV